MKVLYIRVVADQNHTVKQLSGTNLSNRPIFIVQIKLLIFDVSG